MKTILSQLYNGKLTPLDNFSPHSEEYTRRRRKQARSYEAFIARLNEIDTRLADEYIDIMDEQIDLCPLEYSEMFIDGFCLGAKMIIEIYQNGFISKISE